MSTEQPTLRKVMRVCRVVKRDGKPCGRVYYVAVGAKNKGCPECCLELDV